MKLHYKYTPKCLLFSNIRGVRLNGANQTSQMFEKSRHFGPLLGLCLSAVTVPSRNGLL